GSLIASLVVVPLLCWLLLKRDVVHGDNRLVRWCKRLYRPALDWALDHGRAVAALAVGALLASVTVAAFLGSEFLPELNEGTIWINIQLPPSVSTEEARDEGREILGTLRTVPEVDQVIYKAGRPDDGTD